MPPGSKIGCERPQLLDSAPAGGAAGVARCDVKHVEFSFDSGGDASGAPQQSVGAGCCGHSGQNPLCGVPDGPGLVPPQVLDQFVVGLVGEEPERELSQGDEVVAPEEVRERLGTRSFG